MKNQNLVLSVLIGTILFFIITVLLLLFFQKWQIFGVSNQSLKGIIFQQIITSLIFFVIMFLISKRRLEKKKNKSKIIN